MTLPVCGICVETSVRCNDTTCVWHLCRDNCPLDTTCVWHQQLEDVCGICVETSVHCNDTTCVWPPGTPRATSPAVYSWILAATTTHLWILAATNDTDTVWILAATTTHTMCGYVAVQQHMTRAWHVRACVRACVYVLC